MVFQIIILGGQSWIFLHEVLWYNMLNMVVLDVWRWEFHAASEKSSKNPTLFEKSIFYLFWGGFVWGLIWGGLSGKCQSLVRDLNFWPAVHTPQQFSRIAHNTDHLLCAFWTAVFTARPPDIGSIWCNLIFQVSNRTIGCILKRSARLYDDCMEPDHMGKYSLPVLTDLTENPIQKKTFYVVTPCSSEGVFWRVSLFCVHPCRYFPWKIKY